MKHTTEEQAKQRADEAFASHELTVVHESECGTFRQYRCGQPNTVNMSFTITFYPGWVIVSGDIGFFASSRIPDMMQFVRDVLGNGRFDVGYFASKAPSEIETHEFDVRQTKERIREAIEESEIKIPSGDMAEIFAFDDEEGFRYSLEVLDKHGITNAYEYASRDLKFWVLIQCHALEWFIREYDRTHAPTPATVE